MYIKYVILRSTLCPCFRRSFSKASTTFSVSLRPTHIVSSSKAIQLHHVVDVISKYDNLRVMLYEKKSTRIVRRSLSLVCALTLVVSGVSFAAGGSASDDGSNCLDFSDVPDNTSLAVPDIELWGYRLQALDPTQIAFANDTDGSTGLQIPDTGYLITLQSPAETVTLIVGTYHSEVLIEALSVDGQVLHSETYYEANVWNTIVVGDFGSLISQLRVTGGGNEFLIERICTD